MLRRRYQTQIHEIDPTPFRSKVNAWIKIHKDIGSKLLKNAPKMSTDEQHIYFRNQEDQIIAQGKCFLIGHCNFRNDITIEWTWAHQDPELLRKSGYSSHDHPNQTTIESFQDELRTLVDHQFMGSTLLRLLICTLFTETLELDYVFISKEDSPRKERYYGVTDIEYLDDHKGKKPFRKRKFNQTS
jgi:hypothetical protein